ncbi:hypothetical protein [Nitrosospira sp. Nsp13]|uniref:hypothetical protein n=1 Tax=Nitrosospira sp. Nsp13 TaxID=1855332 RepID=UPI0011130B76|nr:hypothetical protein [Nitrosospira sp. Nsp13]
MEKEPLIKLTWHGRETVESIPALLDQAEQIEVILPLNYNHTLFHRLHPHAPAAELEDINVSGGPELLEEIATINGLEGFNALIGTLATARAAVRIASPPKVVITLPVAKSKIPMSGISG